MKVITLILFALFSPLLSVRAQTQTATPTYPVQFVNPGILQMNNGQVPTPIPTATPVFQNQQQQQFQQMPLTPGPLATPTDLSKGGY